MFSTVYFISTERFAGVFTPGLSGANNISITRDILKSWKNINFPSLAASIRYHITKHGGGVSLTQYTKDALNFFKNNNGIGKSVVLRDGSIGVKITTPGGG